MPVSMVEAVMPAPAAAVATATSDALVVYSGGAVPAPVPIVHCASVMPQLPGGVTPGVSPRLAVALLPVSTAPAKRLFEVLT